MELKRDQEIGFWLPYLNYVITKADDNSDNEYFNQGRKYYIIHTLYTKYDSKIKEIMALFEEENCSSIKNYFQIVSKKELSFSVESFRCGKNIDTLNFNNSITNRYNSENPLRVFQSLNPIDDSIYVLKKLSSLQHKFRRFRHLLSIYDTKIDLTKLNFQKKITFEELLFTSYHFTHKIAEYPNRNNMIEFVKKEEYQKIIASHAENVKILIPRDVFTSQNISQIIHLLTKRYLFLYGEENLFGMRTYEDRLRYPISKTKWVDILDKDCPSPYQCIRSDISKNHLSYRNIYLASFLGICSPTYLINNGKLANSGFYGNDDFIEKAIYMGICGSNFKNPLKFDHEFLLVTEEYHNEKYRFGLRNSYYENWAKYYKHDQPYLTIYGKESMFPHFNLIKSDFNKFNHRYTPIFTEKREHSYFDVRGYSLRTSSSYGLYLSVVDKYISRGKNMWIIFTSIVNADLAINEMLQNRITLDCILREIKKFSNRKFTQKIIFELNGFEKGNDTIELFINQKTLKPRVKTFEEINRLIQKIKKSNLEIIFSSSPVFSKVNIGDDEITRNKEDYLVFCNYDWYGGSLPGNEYWRCDMNGKSSSAASCSTIGQLHNPFVNYKILNPSNFIYV